jgi:hypothetical protein
MTDVKLMDGCRVSLMTEGLHSYTGTSGGGGQQEPKRRYLERRLEGLEN